MRQILQLISAMIVVLAIACGAAQGAEGGAVPGGYVIYQSVPIQPRVGVRSITGYLLVLEDARITAGLRREMWHNFIDLDPIMFPDNGDPLVTSLKPLFENFQRHPMRNVLIRLTDGDGHVLDERKLDVPLGEVEEQTVDQDGSVAYLVTIDKSIGAGSYTGPNTYLAAVSDGKLNWQRAIDDATGRRRELILTRSIKTDWRLIHDPRGYDAFLTVGSGLRPAIPNPVKVSEVVIYYSRIAFRAGEWHRITRVEKGIWESDHEFPAESKFPN